MRRTNRSNFSSHKKSRLIRYMPVAIFAVFFGAVGVTAMHASFGAPVDSADGETEAATEPIVVQYKNGVDTQDLEPKYVKHHAVQTNEIPKLRTTVLKVPKSQRDQALKDLQADPLVQSAEPDYPSRAEATTPNDRYYANQTEWIQTHVNEVWDTTKGSPLTIAVVDTGVNANHVDLAGKILTGYDFVNNDNDPTDDEGHGTAVSGVVGALTNNSVGIAGGCWNCNILSVKVLAADASGTASVMAQGLQYAVDHGAKIVNLSLSVGEDSSVLKSAVDYAASHNVLLVAAAGNQAATLPRYPAAYPSVVSVAGTNPDDSLNVGSNSGTTIDIAAPWQVYTTSYPGDIVGGWSGTSFATPIVVATAALLMSAYPNATLANIKAAMITTADTCCSGSIPGGRLNAAKALAYLANLFPPPATLQGDINNDGKVNLTDLSILLSNWNTTNAAADINKNGRVDLTDLSILLSKWTG